MNYPQTHLHRTKSQRGFALIITLSMMVLLTLLAVGLLSLSSISLRGATRGLAQSEARANARLALQLAIGQLQIQLGPDQRINAPADLALPSLEKSKARWLGVWDSWPADQRDRPEPKFRSWLVSGNAMSLADSSYPTGAGGLIPLEMGDAGALISAPRVGLDGGGYAFHIEDENAKARLGPGLVPLAENLGDHLARYHSSPADHRVLPRLDQIDRDDTRLNQLVTDKTVELIAPEPSKPDRLSSYSVWSEGLLTDVRNGGFRQDLSLRLAIPERRGTKSPALYEVQGRGGINMQELRQFQEIPSRLTYGPSRYAHPDGGRLNPEVPTLVGSGSENAAAVDPAFSYLRPIMIRSSWHISAMTKQENPRSPNYDLHIVLEPIVTLWNPHDVNIVLPPNGHMTIRCWGLPYDFNITAGRTNKKFHFNQAAGRTNTSMEIGERTPVVMRPGEVLIFSRGREATTPINGSSRFEGRLGWSGTGGFAIDTGVSVTARDPITISMQPSSTRGATSWGLIEFLSYVGTDSNNNYWNGGLMIDRSGWGGEVTATDFPSTLFKDVPPITFSSPTELLNTPQPIALFSMMARTEEQGTLKTRYLSRLGAAANGYDHQATDDNTLFSLPFEPVMEPLSGGLDRSFDYFNGKGFFGASYKSDLGQTNLVTQSVPREAPISLAAFQHAHANGVEKWTFTGPDAGNFHDRILQPSISHAIGNSFAPPCIAPNAVEGTFNTMAAADHSWLVNDALWDQWFVSSIADRKAPYHTDGQGGTARELFERLANSTGPDELLPNRDFRYAGTDPQGDVDLLFSGSAPKADAYALVGSLMRIHGAFNVNSTDPLAWEAQFRSNSGMRVPVERAEGNRREWEDAVNPIADLLIPGGSAAETTGLRDGSNPEQWTGYRDPTDYEIKELAEEMVEEVRTRGPFLSLADFINRRLVSEGSLATKGALQAALDRSLNEDLEKGSRASSGGPGQVAFPEADQGSMMTHVPGHVKQADVLTSIGSRLSVRSDTFLIRAYGESRSSGGELLASARCEAVVQRNADWLDPADDIEILPENLTRTVNQQFGRRLSVVSFRWISESEV